MYMFSKLREHYLFRFVIDKEYVGEPPAIELTITNLNDNVDKNFLTDMMQKAGFHVDEITIYYHPDNNKHLGIARVILKSSRQLKMCIEKFNNKSVMGKVSFVWYLFFCSMSVTILISDNNRISRSIRGQMQGDGGTNDD